MADDHYTGLEHEGKLIPDGPDAVAEARRMHRIATADPERDGTMTGPAHEKKYGLERVEESVAHWLARGVHPFENRALKPGDEGYEAAVESGQVPAEGDAAVETASPIETAVAPNAPENTAAPRASDQ